jgi:hypothetical protein
MLFNYDPDLDPLPRTFELVPKDPHRDRPKPQRQPKPSFLARAMSSGGDAGFSLVAGTREFGESEDDSDEDDVGTFGGF